MGASIKRAGLERAQVSQQLRAAGWALAVFTAAFLHGDAASASPALNFGRGPAYLAAGGLNVSAVYDVPMGTTPSLDFAGPGAGHFAVNSTAHPQPNVYVFSVTVDTTPTSYEGDAYTATASGGKSVGGTTQPPVSRNGIVDNHAPDAPGLAFTGGASFVASGSHTLTVTYVESMGTTPTVGFSGTGGSHFSVSSTTQIAPRTYVFDISVDSTPTSQGGDGYVLSVTLGKDLTGNVQSAPGMQSGQVDSSAPPVPSLAFSRDPAHLSSGPVAVTAAYSEPIGTTPSLVFDGPGGSHFSIVSTAQPAPSVFIFSVVSDTTATAQGGDDYTATLSGGRDLAGNSQASFAIQTGVLDTAPPGPPSLAFSRGPNIIGQGNFTVTATYTEAMATAPALTFEGAGAGHFSLISTSQIAADTFVFAVAVDTTPTSVGGDGYVARVDAALDFSGNAQTGPAVRSGVIETNPVAQQQQLVCDIFRVVGTSPPQCSSILNAQKTAAIAPVTARDTGLGILISNPLKLPLLATLSSVQTTTPLIVVKAWIDPVSRQPIQTLTATDSERATQILSTALPLEPTTTAYVFGFDPAYPWRSLPRQVAYSFRLFNSVNGQLLQAFPLIQVIPRPPTQPAIQILQPQPGSRFYAGVPISFQTSASDSFDGSGITTQVVWQRASGAAFGYGASVVTTDWPPGQQSFQAVVANSARVSAAASGTVSVVANQPPTYIAIAYPFEGQSLPYGQPVTVVGAATDELDGPLQDHAVHWTVDAEPGESRSGATTSWSFTQPLTNTLRFTVVNSGGSVATTSIHVFVIPPTPTVTWDYPPFGAQFWHGDTVTLQGHATCPPQGTLPGSALTWKDESGHVIGTGTSVITTPMATGVHVLLLEARSSLGQIGRATQAVEITPQQPPWVRILQPHDYDTLYESVPFPFAGWGFDRAHFVSYPPEAHEWTSSLLPKPFSTGYGCWCTLPVGLQELKLAVTSSDATVGFATMPVLVHPESEIPPPVVTIDSPVSGVPYYTGDNIPLAAYAIEYRDVNLFAPQAAWVSDRDGIVARGVCVSPPPMAMLSQGNHVLTVGVTDSRGHTTVATRSVTVLDGSAFPPPTVTIDPVYWPRGYYPVYTDMPVRVHGRALDRLGHELGSGAHFVWTSSLQGQLAEGAAATLSFSVPGSHIVTLAVTDNRPRTGSVSILVDVIRRPPPFLVVHSINPETFYHGNPLQIAVSYADDFIDGSLPIAVSSSLQGPLTTLTPPWAGIGDVRVVHAETCPGQHVLTYSVVNSAGMRVTSTEIVTVMGLLPRSFYGMSQADSPDFRVLYDDRYTDPPIAGPYTIEWYYGSSLPGHRLSTNVIGLSSTIYGQPTTVTVNGVTRTFAYDGLKAQLSVPEIRLTTGLNVIELVASRDTERRVCTAPVIFHDAAVNHAPWVSHLSAVQPYAWGNRLQVNYVGHDDEWDMCQLHAQVSWRPTEQSTDGDWLDCEQASCNPYFQQCPRLFFSSTGQPNWVVLIVPENWPNYPGGGYYWDKRHEGPLWLRAQAYDGQAWGPWTTTVVDFDAAEPRGANNVHIESPSAGLLDVRWDPAVDRNFGTYFLSVGWTDRWHTPPLRHLHIVSADPNVHDAAGPAILDANMSHQALAVTTSLEAALATSTTTRYGLTVVPPGVEVDVRLWARDTHGNTTQGGGTAVMSRTSSDFTDVRMRADHIYPGDNSYAYSLAVSLPVDVTLARTAAVVATIYHASSSSVVRTMHVTAQVGVNRVSWDGRNDAGQLVEDGEYAIRFQSGAAGSPLSTSNAYFFQVSY